MTNEKVRKGDREHFTGTLDRAFEMNVLKSESRHVLDMIDVDDKDPETWLKRIREAIGDTAIEMIVETKNGYHVLYHAKRMTKDSHRQLSKVLHDNPGKGPMEKATKSKGPSIQCALPGGSQAYHPTRIWYCSCQRMKDEVPAMVPSS